MIKEEDEATKKTLTYSRKKEKKRVQGQCTSQH